MTLVNLIANGSFEVDANSDGTPDGFANYAYDSLVTDPDTGQRSLTLTGDGSEVYYRVRVATSARPTVTAGHVYYLALRARTNIPTLGAYFMLGSGELGTIVPASGEWEHTSVYARPLASGTQETIVVFKVRGNSVWTAADRLTIDDFVMYDVTAEYGAGNEPPIDVLDAIVRGPAPARALSAVVRVQTFNAFAVQAQYTHCQRMVGQIVRSIDPDIVAAQECWDNRARTEFSFAETFGGRRAWTEFQAQTPYFTDWDKGRGIASTYPLAGTTWSAAPSQGVLRSVATIGGQRVAVYSIHNPYSSTLASAEGYMAALWDLVSADPEPHVIVAGDMNYPAASQGGGIDGFAPFILAGWTTAQHHLGWVSTTQPEEPTVNPLDNVIVSPGLAITAAGVEETYEASDHRTLWADVIIPGYRRARRGAAAGFL